MEILKFNDFISEQLWSKGIKRSQAGTLRKEDGIKVKTDLGIEIIIRNTDCDYNQLIMDIMDSVEGEYGPSFDSFNNIQDDNDYKKSILDGTCKFSFVIRDNPHDRLIVTFEEYNYMVDYDYINPDEFSEDDYYSIIKGIAEALKTVNIERTNKGRYVSEYAFLLMDESNVYDFECNLSENTVEIYFDDFKDYFEDTFPDVDLEFWSYNNYANNIGLKINYNSLKQFNECKKFIDDYYNNIKDYYEDDDSEEI